MSIATAFKAKKENVFISIGGGTASSVLVPLVAMARHTPKNIHCAIAVIEDESPDVWRLMDWLDERLVEVGASKVVRVSHDKASPAKYTINPDPANYVGIWDVFHGEGMMGSSRADPCSRVLKRETMRRYILDTHSPEDTEMWFGIKTSEIDRILNIRRNWGSIGYDVIAPLDELTQDECSAIFGKYGFDNDARFILAEENDVVCQTILGWIPELYDLNFSHNNCGGFCVKAGVSQFRKLYRFFPERAIYHAEQEALFNKKRLADGKGAVSVLKSGQTLQAIIDDERSSPKMVDMFPDDDTTGCKFCDAMA